MTQAAENNAKVVLLRGIGAEPLQQAIAQGLVGEDVRREIERVISDNGKLRRENNLLRMRVNDLEARQREYLRIHVAAYGAHFERRKKMRTERDYFQAITIVGFIAGALFTSILTTIAICWQH